MSIRLSKAKLCQILSAHSLRGCSEFPAEKITFRGVEFDSREIRGGELFIALKGSAQHGHEYVNQVLQRGAALVVVEDAERFKNHADAERIVAVPDTLQAFSTLAQWWRRELNIPLLAITGSVGKTTVKEITAHLLMAVGPGTYSLKSHNNHVGVPYTLCRINPEHSWAVIEMGMNHAEELRTLSKIAEPDFAAVTIIAPAHIENFSSIEGITAAKFEIVDGLRPQGTLIVRSDDPQQKLYLQKHFPEKKLTVRSFGADQNSDVRVLDLKSRGMEGISFTLETSVSGKNEREEISMSLLGTQNAFNVACAVCAATLLKPELSLATMAERLRNFSAPLMRLNLKIFAGERKLIDDSYNANPASMGAFLDFAADLQASGSSVGLIVGDMLELGKFAEEYHQYIGARIAALKPAFVVAVGSFAETVVAQAKQQGIETATLPSAEAAAQFAKSHVADVVMVKASRGIGLDKAVKALVGSDQEH